MKATKQQIAEWKKEHTNVYEISVDGYHCYLKSPTRQILSMAAVASQENPIRGNEVLLEKCWLGGDEIIKTDDTLFLATGKQITKIIETKEASLEKL